MKHLVLVIVVDKMLQDQRSDIPIQLQSTVILSN